MTVKTARSEDLVGCRRCAKVWEIGTTRCARCNARLSSRDSRSLPKVWTWLALGILAYIPANLYPMLETRALFTRSNDTIIVGALKLADHGAWLIAAVILLASVVIPIAKMLAVGYLAYSVRDGAKVQNTSRMMKLYHFVEFIGRWSMVDVFVVAVLSSLVQLNFIAKVSPGPGALAFALSVIFTMLAAQAFDSRLIWDRRVD